MTQVGQMPRLKRTVLLASNSMCLLAGLWPYSAFSSPYGCTVLLCLSNPNGPQAVAECVGPIEQLKRDLRRGRGMPKCEEAQSAAHAAINEQPWYDACPTGTQPLASGERASRSSAGVDSVGPFLGIGDGSGVTEQTSERGTPADAPKVCVGNRIGEFNTNEVIGDSVVTRLVGVYDRIDLVQPHPAGGIGVFVNGVMYRRVNLTD